MSETVAWFLTLDRMDLQPKPSTKAKGGAGQRSKTRGRITCKVFWGKDSKFSQVSYCLKAN